MTMEEDSREMNIKRLWGLKIIILMIPLFSDMRGPQGFKDFKDFGLGNEQIPVRSFVNNRLLNKLIKEFEVPDHAAAKALYFSGNKSLEKAIDWVERNQDSADFNKPMNVFRPNQFMGPSDQFGGFPQRGGKKLITKEMKNFKDNYAKTVDKWKYKLDYEGELKLLNGLTGFMETEEDLNDLIAKKENGEWKKCEIEMLRTFDVSTKIPEVRLMLEPVKRRPQGKRRADYFAGLIAPFRDPEEHNEEYEPATEEDDDEDSDNDIESKVDRIKGLIEEIKKIPEDNQKKCLDSLKKILQGLISEPNKYRVLLNSDEELKNNINVVEKAKKILRVIGYKREKNKISIGRVSERLMREALEVFE